MRGDAQRSVTIFLPDTHDSIPLALPGSQRASKNIIYSPLLRTADPIQSGDDDYFSSDLDESFVSEVWNRFQQPVMALQSAEDEFVPDKIDKQALVDSWKKISPKVHELSGLIPGASHTVKKPESQQWLAERVVQFLNQV